MKILINRLLVGVLLLSPLGLISSTLTLEIVPPRDGSVTFRDFGLTEIPRGLDTIPNLRELDLSCNPIESLRGLPRLSQLEVLTMSKTRLFRLAGLPNSTGIRRLNLSHGCLTGRDLASLPPMPRLESLDLSYNQIDTLEFLYVYLYTGTRSNQRPSTSPTLEDAINRSTNAGEAFVPSAPTREFSSQFHPLKRINLRNNNISSLDNIITPLPSELSFLDLRNNPISEEEVQLFRDFLRNTRQEGITVLSGPFDVSAAVRGLQVSCIADTVAPYPANFATEVEFHQAALTQRCQRTHPPTNLPTIFDPAIAFVPRYQSTQEIPVDTTTEPETNPGGIEVEIAVDVVSADDEPELEEEAESEDATESATGTTGESTTASTEDAEDSPEESADSVEETATIPEESVENVDADASSEATPTAESNPEATESPEEDSPPVDDNAAEAGGESGDQAA